MSSSRSRQQTSPAGPVVGRVAIERDGSRLDLTVDGISYSTFHPDDPWSGYVWDALAAAILLGSAPRPRVLLLGAGGGTVLALARRIAPAARLTAVDLDPRIVSLARERFGLDELGARVVIGDGVEMLARSRARFDVILDDMYAPGPGGLRRPVADEASHARLVASRLAPAGIAVTNSTTDGDPPGLERSVLAAHRGTFAHVLKLRPRRGYNVVFASSRAPLDPRRIARAAADLGPIDREGLLAIRTGRA